MSSINLIPADSQSDLSSVDSLDEADLLEASSALSASNEDVMKTAISDVINDAIPNGTNSRPDSAENTEQNEPPGGDSNKGKLVKQKSLIPQAVKLSQAMNKAVKRSSCVSDLTKTPAAAEAGNNKNGKKTSSSSSPHSSTSSSKENIHQALPWKHDGASKSMSTRPCSIDQAGHDAVVSNASTDTHPTAHTAKGHHSNRAVTAGVLHVALHANKPDIKETSVSLRRKELAHKLHNTPIDENEYLTPYQRKDKLISELKADLKMAQTSLKEKEEELQFMKDEQDTKIQQVSEQLQ